MGTANTTRKRILDKGLAMASQHGLEAVTLGVLASNVGMSKSGLFAHFYSKEAVQLSLQEHSDKFAAPVVVEPAMKASFTTKSRRSRHAGEHCCHCLLHKP